MCLNNKLGRLLFFTLLFCFWSCKKFVEVKAPITSTNAANVYSSDATAAAVLTGVYMNMSASNITDAGITAMSFLPSLSSDELTLINGTNNLKHVAYYTNSLTSTNVGNEFWRSIYPMIFVANSAIEGLSNSTALSQSARNQLLGEAKFIRAFCYFYLVNLYGDVPLAISSDPRINSSLARSGKPQVWNKIVEDLKDAITLLSDKYLKSDAVTAYSSGSEERVRPTKWAAIALLARVYLFEGNWQDAETQSSLIISNSALFGLTTLSQTFLKNNKEAIWQLQPALSVLNTWEGFYFVLPSTGPNSNLNSVYLSNNLINSFEPGDQRKTSWVGSVTPTPSTTYYFPYKYKAGLNAPLTEYETILRLGEQYLIRAEARAQLGNINGAQSDLNVIRTRAGLGATTANSQAGLVTAILHERQIELFTEWGHRWLDLKRTKTVDAVMAVVTPLKGGTWNTNWQWYPIPQGELLFAPNLTQNSGY